MAQDFFTVKMNLLTLFLVQEDFRFVTRSKSKSLKKRKQKNKVLIMNFTVLCNMLCAESDVV